MRISEHIVDFQILGKSSILLDMIEDTGRNAQRVGELQNKMQKIIKRDHLYYWIPEEEGLSANGDI